MTGLDLSWIDWPQVAQGVAERGYAKLPNLIDAELCDYLRKSYANEALFRNHIIMARHGFGQGEYKYFSNPLPPPVAELRNGLYPPLAALANRWIEALKLERPFPTTLSEFTKRCHDAGQTRPTPLLLKYGPGDYNCLHRDLYDELAFPLQAAILLDRPGANFTGGEFVLTEQRPRMQSRAEVVHLEQGDAVIFPVDERPVQGTRGTYRVRMRHGVSRIHTGERHTLGIIFHDAA